MAQSTNFDEFYKDLKETEIKDSSLTPKQQIERLLRPGSTYRNLNPYEVLQIDPDVPIEEVKKKYRRLSILVHPDKNQDDSERAQVAFDAVKKAYSLLENEETRRCCYDIVEEARGRTKQNMEEKRKKLKKEASTKGLDPNSVVVEEDNPIAFQKAVSILTMKLFADLELKRRQNEEKISKEAGRKREEELQREEQRKLEEEFNKNWEEGRQNRVNSWNTFKSGMTMSSSSGPSSSTLGEPPVKKKKKEKKEKKFSPMGFRPPKHKPESR